MWYEKNFEEIAYAEQIAQLGNALRDANLLLSPFEELNGEFWGSDPYDDGPQYY